MKIRNRLYKREAEAASGRRSALLEAIAAVKDLVPVWCGNYQGPYQPR